METGPEKGHTAIEWQGPGHMSSFLLKSSEQNYLLLPNEIKPKLLPSGEGCDYVFHMPFALKGMLRDTRGGSGPLGNFNLAGTTMAAWILLVWLKK